MAFPVVDQQYQTFSRAVLPISARRRALDTMPAPISLGNTRPWAEPAGGRSAGNAIGFHLAKLLDEHLLRNRRDRTFQIREAQHVSTEEVKQDNQLPATLENLEGILHTLSRQSRCQISVLTFR